MVQCLELESVVQSLVLYNPAQLCISLVLVLSDYWIFEWCRENVLSFGKHALLWSPSQQSYYCWKKLFTNLKALQTISLSNTNTYSARVTFSTLSARCTYKLSSIMSLLFKKSRCGWFRATTCYVCNLCDCITCLRADLTYSYFTLNLC